jgi:hypothetical protein
MNPHAHATDWYIAVKHCTDLALLETQAQDERLTFPQKEFLYKRLGEMRKPCMPGSDMKHIIYDLGQVAKPNNQILIY